MNWHDEVVYGDACSTGSTSYLFEPVAFTVTLKAVLGVTELHIVQEGVPDVIPAEMCYQGWQESLIQLAQLVDPEIPDEG